MGYTVYFSLIMGIFGISLANFGYIVYNASINFRYVGKKFGYFGKIFGGYTGIPLPGIPHI